MKAQRGSADSSTLSLISPLEVGVKSRVCIHLGYVGTYVCRYVRPYVCMYYNQTSLASPGSSPVWESG
jgi:hypothetical protein